MSFRRFAGGTVLLCAGLLSAQPEPKKVADDTREAAVADATREAQRQGRVALSPNAMQSPNQSVAQAVAFERYKELAAGREARKEAGGRELRTAAAGSQKR